MRTSAIGAVCLLLAAAAAAGCIGNKGGDALTVSAQQQKADDILGKQGHQKLVDAAAIIPKNYSFPQQRILPSTNITLTGTVGPDAIGGYEAEKDEGGIEYNTVTKLSDISTLLPPGQPAELVLKLYYDGSEVNSADIDIAVDVPGLKTSYSNDSETLNWNYVVKTTVVNTIGVAGQPAKVGVQIASAIASKGFDYKLEVHATYVKDVLTPYHPWAIDVPGSASGLIFESEKAGGDEHVTTQFVLVDPNDDLVQFVDFNDINIPTQSVFVPTPQAGTYVFYAYNMHGGFLRVKADVPLQHAIATPLAIVTKSVVDSVALAPGVAGKDFLNGTLSGGPGKDDVGATTTQFAPEGPFPLRVTPYVKAQAAGMAKITLSSPKGMVAQRTLIVRYQDDRGTLGYTSDHEEGQDNVANWKNIAKGAWKADIVNDNPTGLELGHIITTYARGGA